jgi:hypothetical protein
MEATLWKLVKVVYDWILIINLKLLSYILRKLMEQRTLRNVSNYLNTNIYSYLETSGGQNYNLYLKVVHFLNISDN